MQNKYFSNIAWILIGLLLLLFDQISKTVVTELLVPNDMVLVLPGFSLILVFNTGAAFSLLSNSGGWQTSFFIIQAIVASIYLVYLLFKVHYKYVILKIGIICVLAGAIGNMIDRILYGYVIDFILLYYSSYSWPIFNIADGFITVGAIILIYHVLFKRQYI